jgi:hypothetical protein
MAAAFRTRAWRALRLKSGNDFRGNCVAGEVFNTTNFMPFAMNGKGKGYAITSRTAGATNPVHIIFSLHRQIKVNDVTDGLYINTTSCNISRNQDTHPPILYLFQGA